MRKFEEYRKTGANNEELLFEIMNNCEIIEDIFKMSYNYLNFDFEYRGIRIEIDNKYGSPRFGDMSTNEFFYYEDLTYNPYLTSGDTEYVLSKDAQITKEPEKNKEPLFQNEDTSSDMDRLSYDAKETYDNIEFATYILGRSFDSSYNVNLSDEELSFFANEVELFGVSGGFVGAYTENGWKQSRIDMLDWTTTNTVNDINSILEALMLLYGETFYVDDQFSAFDGNDITEAYTWMDVQEYEAILCWHNPDNTITIRWVAPLD